MPNLSSRSGHAVTSVTSVTKVTRITSVTPPATTRVEVRRAVTHELVLRLLALFEALRQHVAGREEREEEEEHQQPDGLLLVGRHLSRTGGSAGQDGVVQRGGREGRGRQESDR